MSEFGAWLLREMDKRGWNASELARRAGVSASNVSTIISGVKQPGFDFCVKTAPPLGYPPEMVLRAAGLLPPLPAPDGDPLLAELLATARALPSIERQRLVGVARLFLTEYHERGEADYGQ